MPKKTPRKVSAPKPTEIVARLLPGQKYVLKALVLENGSCLFEDWLKEIKDMQTKQRIQARLDRVVLGNLGDCKPIGEGVFEFRMDFGPGYRIYYAVAGTAIIVLLVGGDKSSQERNILTAQTLWKDNRDETQRYRRNVRR